MPRFTSASTSYAALARSRTAALRSDMPVLLFHGQVLQQRGLVFQPPETIEIAGDGRIREDRLRLGEHLLLAVPARDVCQNQLPDLCVPREARRLRRRQGIA